MSRSHAGKLTVDLTAMWLSEAIQPTLNAADQDASAKGMKMTYQPNDEPLRVEADPVRLEQIVWSLLSNAIKFSRPGGAIDRSNCSCRRRRTP